MNLGLVPAKWARLTPRNEAIVDSTTGKRITFADFDAHVRRLANGLRGLGLDAGDRVGMLSQNSIEYAALYFACARAGLVTQPMNWRLSAPELAKIVANGEPRAYITQDRFVSSTTELQGLVDGVDHWLQYGPDGDGSYEALLDGASDDEPEWSSTAKDDDPVFILYTGGTTGESKGALAHPPQRVRRHAQPDGRRAHRAERRVHAHRADVPHPRRAGDELHGARPTERADELRRQAGDGADRGRARVGVPRRHHDDQLDDGGRELLVLQHLVAAQLPVRRRTDAVAGDPRGAWTPSPAR